MGAQLQQQFQAFMASAPDRFVAELVAGAIVLIVLSIYVRGSVGTLIRILVFFGAIAVIAVGSAILMNNVSLAGPPSPAVRLYRFLTVNWAATSEKGDGAAACADPQALAARQPVDIERHERRHQRHVGDSADVAAASSPPPVADKASSAAPTEQDFPELVRNSYPGIPPERLMQLAASTVSSLPGWELVNTDAKTLTVNARYHTRVFDFVDDIRIVVTPRSEVDLCSRSRTGEDARWPMNLLHADFGANVGHIKEFYLALAPAVNEAYRRLEIEQTAQQHGVKLSRP